MNVGESHPSSMNGLTLSPANKRSALFSLARNLDRGDTRQSREKENVQVCVEYSCGYNAEEMRAHQGWKDGFSFFPYLSLEERSGKLGRESKGQRSQTDSPRQDFSNPSTFK